MHDPIATALAALALTGPVVLIALAVATLVSEDLACIGAGLLVAQGSLGFLPATGACFAGIFGGDLLLVLLGRTVGRRSLGAVPLRWWVSAAAVRRAEHYFQERGPGLILASRFLPGTRLPTYVAAGVLRLPLWRFLGWFVVACALWTPLLVGGAYVFGDVTLRWLARWQHAVPGLLAAGFATVLVVRLARSVATWRGRRLWLGRWRRLTRWEFWPQWAVYAPVVAHILWLGWRHRSLTLFTAVNPGMANGGGLAGESKSEILRGLAGAGDRVARWELLPAGTERARLDAALAFLRREHLEFPLVIKPDVGERGRDVVIAREVAAVAAALAAIPGPAIVQAYVPGVEFGVFYVRKPSQARGEIFALTEKRRVGVTGDGRRPLADLILADDRAVCLAPFFLRQFAARLDEVPGAGERIWLSELGTHCRGSLFLDGAELHTAELAEAIERVSRCYAGFHFGRYDVRAPSLEAFRRGEFTVIELNGLTSEATSIYDPRHSAAHGWRTLCRQWSLAFAIAAEHRARGLLPLTVRATWRLAVGHFSSP